MSEKMRAGDLRPGWYHAHGNSFPDLLIHEVEHRPEQHAVTIDYTYGRDSRHVRGYDVDRLWSVRPVEHVIQEEFDWRELLTS